MLLNIFYVIDNFCKDFEKQFDTRLLGNGKNIRNRSFKLTLAEVMTITIWYNQSGYKTFKDYYEKEVLQHLRGEFPNLVSYNRFVELKNKIIIPLSAFLYLVNLNNATDIAYIDSFPLRVSHIKRASSHKTFKGIAKKGKTSVGWFYGFKLHLVINQFGEIIAFLITSGNVSDINEKVLCTLTENLTGKLFGDKGYMVNKDWGCPRYN